MACLTLAGASGAKGLDQPEMKMKTGRMLPVAMHPHFSSPPSTHTHTLHPTPVPVYTCATGPIHPGHPCPRPGGAGAPHPAPSPGPQAGSSAGAEGQEARTEGVSCGGRLRPRECPCVPGPKPQDHGCARRGHSAQRQAARTPPSSRGAPTAAIPSAPKAPHPPGARAAAGDSDLCWNLV